MIDRKLYNELLSIEAEAQVMRATADSLIERCCNARKKLQPVSTGGSKNKGLSQTEVAKVLAKRRKNMLKKAS